MSVTAENWFRDDRHSIAWVQLDGVGDVVRNNVSTTRYELIRGKVRFNVGLGPTDSEVIDLQVGEVVVIPSGATYQDIGHASMLVTSYPPFNPEDVLTIKHKN